MLIIRKEQLTKLQTLATDRFVESMGIHVATYFPDVYRREGGGQVCSRIRHAIELAAQYGIRGMSDICKLINLNFQFGDDFLDNPEFDWVREVLQSDQEDRMACIYEAVILTLQTKEM